MTEPYISRNWSPVRTKEEIARLDEIDRKIFIIIASVLLKKNEV